MRNQSCDHIMTDGLRSGIVSTKGSVAGISHLPLAVLSLAVLLFLSRGFLHILVVPMWEGFDEPFHYAYLQYMAEHRNLPPLNAPAVSREILESLQLFPTTYHLSHLTPIRFKNFWELSVPDRIRLRQSLDSIEPASKSHLTDMANYQTQHPPLYYLLCTPLYLLGRHLRLVERVFLLRVFSILLAAVSLPLGYLLARRIFKNSWAILVPVLMALFPNHYVFVGRITNDALAVVIFPLLILATGKLYEKPLTPGLLWSIGCLLGLGLLTKAYFLTAVPVVLIIVLLKRVRGETSSKQCIFALLLLLVPTTLLAGWWYWRNYMEVGTFSGLAQAKMTSSLPMIAWLKGLWYLRLGQFGALLFKLHLWAGNWSFRTAPSAYYQVFGVVYVLCAVGLIRSYLKTSLSDTTRTAHDREAKQYLMTTSGFLLSFLVGMFYHRWAFTVAGLYSDPQSFGAIGSEGWYLNVLLPVEAILLLLGVQRLVAIRGATVAAVTLLGLFFALDQVALWNREIPYYAGLSIRVAQPFTNPGDAVKHVTVSLALALRRVAFLGPHWSSESLLLSLVMLTLGITVVTMVLVRRCLS